MYLRVQLNIFSRVPTALGGRASDIALKRAGPQTFKPAKFLFITATFWWLAQYSPDENLISFKLTSRLFTKPLNSVTLDVNEWLAINKSCN
jgi:hypothetical protein